MSRGLVLLLVSASSTGLQCASSARLDASLYAPPELKAIAFPLSAVRLAPDSRLQRQFDANTDWLMNLNVTSLACLYTSAANLTCSTQNWPFKCIAGPKQPACTPYHHQAYFGHYLGHYLSATAMAFEASGNVTVKARGTEIVSLLGKVQKAFGQSGEPGLVYPYNVRSFQNLYDKAQTRPGGDGGGNCQPVCVPFYVLHKMLAGMLDQYTRAGNLEALKIAIGIGDWVVQSIEGMIQRYGMAKWQGVLDTEWGGMNEAMFNLYELTGNVSHLNAGKRFNHFQWTAPLAIGQDNLDGSYGNVGGNHANTHLPEVVGSAKGYELTGNATMRAIVTNFFDILTAGENKHWNPAKPGGHSYATGGSNAAEHWFAADKLGDSLLRDSPIRGYPHAGSHTEESCTTYNALKVSRHMYSWTADAALGDYYERTLLNGILGNQNLPRGSLSMPSRDPPHTVELEYMLPLGGGGLTKPWGLAGPTGHFPCCWGTLSEQFAKLGDSIYYRSPDNSTLFVNLFASSTLRWQERSVVLTQDASGFVTSDRATILHFKTMGFEGRGELHGKLGGGSAWSIAIRVPWWATSKNSIILNDVPVDASQIVAGKYCILGPREWKSSDTVSVFYSPSLRFEQLDDARSQFDGFGTIHYGPLLLAGMTTQDSLLLDNTSDAAVQRVVKRAPGANGLRFVATPGESCSNAPNITFIPFNEVRNHDGNAAYTTYFHTKAKHFASVTAGGTPHLHLGSASDFTLAGGASISSVAKELEITSIEHGDVSLGGHQHHDDLTHRALADPLYSRSAGMVGDYDPATGNHYKLANLERSLEGPFKLHSGIPRTNSSAMMAAPFASYGILESVSFSFNFTVGMPAQARKNVSCSSDTALAGGSIHVANMSSVETAIRWCQNSPKCAGFCAQASTCAGHMNSSTSRGNARQMTQYLFKDSWGVAHHTAKSGWTAWKVPPPPPSTAIGASVRLAFHRDLNCPLESASATKNVTWLWSSRKYLPCKTDPEGCSQLEHVSVSKLGLRTAAVEPSALALHFENGDHNLALELPLSIDLTWK